MSLLHRIIKKNKAITLLELLISIVFVSILIMGIYTLQEFSDTHVISADRRARVQNTLAFALEHMSTYVSQANSSRADPTNPGIRLFGGNGFQVRVDFNNPQTPSNTADDAWVRYTLSGNNLRFQCTPAARCGPLPTSPEVLSDKVLSGFVNDVMPQNPGNGFYVAIGNNASSVDVGLAGRYDPSSATIAINPTVWMKTKLVCNNASAN